MTLTFDCPWCGDPLSAQVDAPAVCCAACAISVDLADPIVTPVAALSSAADGRAALAA
ncbi:MAG TPA: hypothetical protein VK656_04620 [Candidatus Acidoferrum sp.]|nr:hypothetical protein [Candidatus Acidoferrum sp.]